MSAVGPQVSLVVNSNDPQVQKTAMELAETLNRMVGPQDAIAISIVVTAELLKAVLHCESAIPEHNIEQVEKFLDSLKAHVMQHADCAFEAAGIDRKKNKKVTVH